MATKKTDPPVDEQKPAEKAPLPRHELVTHEQALGPVHGANAPRELTKAGHDQRLRGGAMRVQALKALFHENQRIKAGEVFTLVDPKKFKSGQMVEVTDERPAKPQQAFIPDPFPFPAGARVKRGIPGMPRTAQGTRPTLDARSATGFAQPAAGDLEALGPDPDAEPTVLE